MWVLILQWKQEIEWSVVNIKARQLPYFTVGEETLSLHTINMKDYILTWKTKDEIRGAKITEKKQYSVLMKIKVHVEKGNSK